MNTHRALSIDGGHETALLGRGGRLAGTGLARQTDRRRIMLLILLWLLGVPLGLIILLFLLGIGH